MSRESTIKAVSGALQAKSLDLTQYARARSASRERAAPQVAGDVAAGALGFAADALASALLRLKYADQHSKTLYDRVIYILLDRHAGLASKRGAVVSAVANMALFEWLHDSCQACRPRRVIPKSPPTCPDCKARDLGDHVFGVPGTVAVKGRELEAALIGARPGCPKCHGLGRIFPKKERQRGGVRCLRCRGRGRVEFHYKHRFNLVNGLLADMRLPDGRSVALLTLDSYRAHWSSRYHGFLDILREVDAEITEGLDLYETPSHTPRTSEK